MQTNKDDRAQHLADCGWAAMQQLLNKEMPVSTTRERSSYYYRGLVMLLLLLSFSTGLWYGRHSRQSVPVPASSVNAVLPTKNNVEFTQTTTLRPITDPVPQPSYYNSGLLLPDAFWIAAPEPVFTTKSVDIAIPTTVSTLAEPSTALFSSVAATQEPLTTHQQQSLADATALPQKYAAPVLVRVLPDAPLPPLVKQAETKPKPQLWSIGLMTGLLSRRGNDFSGWNAGVNVDWQPLRKVGLRASASYVYHHRLIQEVPTVYMPFNLYDEVWRELYNNQPAPPSILANAASSDIELPVLGTHRAESALSMFWEFLPRTRLYWGAYAGRTMGVSIARPKIEPDAFSAAPEVNKIANNPVLNKAVSNYVAEQLPDWFYGWSSGMSYEPMRRLELSFSYQRTWPKLRRDAELDAYRWDPRGSNGLGRFFRSREGDFPGRLQLSATYWLK
jgi:hypothetical protein